ncbi:hypothetical protein BC833DRAFT_418329 [Globomyces pollinis-pini]|nr:hypothetical protein BC833DRAFT_418329 [Globomyces pollinis-pini]
MTKQKRLETDLASRPDEDLFFVDKKGEDSIITNPVQSYFNQDFIPLDSKLPKNNTRYPKNNNKTQSKKFKNQSPTQQKKTAGNIKRQQERERQTLERKLLADEILRDYMEHMDQDSIIENSITLQNTDLLLSDSDLNSEDDSDSELDFEENQFEVLMEELDDIDYDSDELRIESNSELDSNSGSDTNQYTYDSNNSQSNNKHSTMVMEMMKQSNHPHRNVDSESSSDDDSVDIAVSLGKSLKQTHIFDLDEEERFIKSEFEGKINTWELSPTTLAKMIEMTDSDEEFTNRLEGNYRFKPRKNSKFLDEEDSESDDSQPIDFGKSKRRKLEKLRRRRQKQELKRQQIENLNFSNELSKGLKSQRKGYNHDHIVTDLQRVLRNSIMFHQRFMVKGIIKV